MKLLKIFLISITLICCQTNKKTSLKIDQTSNFSLKILFDKSSIDKDSIYGKIKYYFNIEDTLKVTENDERRIFILFKIKPNQTDSSKTLDNISFEKELKFSTINMKDTIIVPFKLKKVFTGDSEVIGGISDNLVLNSYHQKDGNVRFTTFERAFKEKVFIK